MGLIGVHHVRFAIYYLIDYGNMGNNPTNVYNFPTMLPLPNSLSTHKCLEPSDFHVCKLCELGYDTYLDTDLSEYCYRKCALL